MKKIHLLALCMASCLAFSAYAFTDAGPPQTKKEIVVIEPSVAQFHSFEITAINVDDLVIYSQPETVVLMMTPEKIGKIDPFELVICPDTDVGWQTSGPKISDNGICRIRFLRC